MKYSKKLEELKHMKKEKDMTQTKGTGKFRKISLNAFLDHSIGIIGAGNMGSALAAGLIKKGNKKLYAADHDETNLSQFKDNSVKTSTSNKETARNSEAIIIAVKPQQIDEVLYDIKDVVEGKLVISIAAGTSLEYLQNCLDYNRVVRTMPFLGSRYGYGATAYVAGKGCTKQDKELVEYIFGNPGFVFEAKEEQMEAVTILASKIGWDAQLNQTMLTELEKQGLSSEVIRRYIAAILRTQAAMIEEGKSFSDIYSTVASKGGTTQSGHEYGAEKGFYELHKGMIGAAIRRCKELCK